MDLNDPDDNELRPEQDLHAWLEDGVRGKYVARYRAGANLAKLSEPNG